MAIEFNATMNQFVNWANRDGIGKTDLVHAKKTQGTLDNVKVAMSGNTADGIGFFASRRRSADIKELNNATRELFMRAVMDLFGATTIDGVPKSVRDKMKLSDYDGEGHPLSAHRIRSVAEAARIALASRAFSVRGSGEAATAVKNVFNAKMATLHGSKNDKMAALKSEMDRIAKNRFNLAFASDMKDQQEGHASQFDLDHYRLLLTPKFKIGNETLTFDANTPLAEKQDVIAKFVRKDMNAKFADLQGADLHKAHAVMSILAQRFSIAMLDGVTKALSAGPTSDAPIVFGQPSRTARNTRLSLSFDDAGALRVRFATLLDNPQITHSGPHFHKVYAGFKTGSSVNLAADVEIPADEFEKIANADYTQFDETAPQAVMHRQPDEDVAGTEAMGPFRFGPGVRTSVSCSTVVHGGGLLVDDEF
jgi:hypothetical protein